MKKRHILLGLVVIMVLAMFILKYKKEEKIQTREEIVKIEKEKKFEIEVKEAKKELEETIKRNEKMIAEIEKKDVLEKEKLEEIKKAILSEKDSNKREEKLDTFLVEIDGYKYDREFSIPILEEIKLELSEKEIIKINKRLYKLYQSIDEFDKAEEINLELGEERGIEEEIDDTL